MLLGAAWIGWRAARPARPSVMQVLVSFKGDGAKKAYTDYVTATEGCKKFVMPVGDGMNLKLAQVSGPALSVGDESHLGRFSGVLAGKPFQLDQSVVRVGDVLIGIHTLHVGTTPEEQLSSDATEKAVAKVKAAPRT